MTIWNILLIFWDIFDHLIHSVFIWYIFSGFGITYQEKSGNPGRNDVTREKSLSEFLFIFVPQIQDKLLLPLNKIGRLYVCTLAAFICFAFIYFLVSETEKMPALQIYFPLGYNMYMIEM
jgi:hypothetical protein